jgi:polyisoprenoid-binding protein YceI
MASLLLLALARPAAGAGAAGPAGVPAGEYDLDPRRGSLVLKLPAMIGVRPTLRLTQLGGSFRYDPATWQSTVVTLRADPRAMDASSPSVGRLAAKLIEPAAYPTILFRSTSLTASEDGRAKLAGTLLFHGVTRPLVLDVDFEGAAASALDVRVKFSGRGSISRSAFGITAGRPFVGDTVDLVFDLDFVRRGG